MEYSQAYGGDRLRISLKMNILIIIMNEIIFILKNIYLILNKIIDNLENSGYTGGTADGTAETLQEELRGRRT